MSGYNIDIADMQCWVFRMAQSKWKMSPTDCAELELFKKYNIRILKVDMKNSCDNWWTIQPNCGIILIISTPL